MKNDYRFELCCHEKIINDSPKSSWVNKGRKWVTVYEHIFSFLTDINEYFRIMVINLNSFWMTLTLNIPMNGFYAINIWDLSNFRGLDSVVDLTRISFFNNFPGKILLAISMNESNKLVNQQKKKTLFITTSLIMNQYIFKSDIFNWFIQFILPSKFYIVIKGNFDSHDFVQSYVKTMHLYNVFDYQNKTMMKMLLNASFQDDYRAHLRYWHMYVPGMMIINWLSIHFTSFTCPLCWDSNCSLPIRLMNTIMRWLWSNKVADWLQQNVCFRCNHECYEITLGEDEEFCESWRLRRSSLGMYSVRADWWVCEFTAVTPGVTVSGSASTCCSPCLEAAECRPPGFGCICMLVKPAGLAMTWPAYTCCIALGGPAVVIRRPPGVRLIAVATGCWGWVETGKWDCCCWGLWNVAFCLDLCAEKVLCDKDYK